MIGLYDVGGPAGVGVRSLEGFAVTRIAEGVSVSKQRAPLFHGVWLLPFLVAGPVMSGAALLAAYGCLSATSPSEGDLLPLAARLGLAFLFLLAGVIPVWVSWHILVVLSPGSRIVTREQDRLMCMATVLRMPIRRVSLRTDALVVVQVYESKGDPCVLTFLRDSSGKTFRLTIPTCGGSSEKAAERSGRALMRTVPDALGLEIACEYPQRKKRRSDHEADRR